MNVPEWCQCPRCVAERKRRDEDAREGFWRVYLAERAGVLWFF